MMLRHAPMNTSVTLALPKPRLHVTMKCEHELRRDLNPSQRRDTHMRYISSRPCPFFPEEDSNGRTRYVDNLFEIPNTTVKEFRY